MTSRAQDWALRAQGRTGGGPTAAVGVGTSFPCLGPSPHSFKKPLHHHPPPTSPIPAGVCSRPHWLTFPQTIPWSKPCCEAPGGPRKGARSEAGELGLNSYRFCLPV